MRTLLLPLVVVAGLASASQPTARDERVTGLYSDMELDEEGDVGGVEILLSLAFVNGGEEIKYFAYVQIAEGVPTEPQLVPAIVDGRAVTFSLTGRYSAMSPFRGEVRGDSLIGRFSNGWALRLPRVH